MDGPDPGAQEVFGRKRVVPTTFLSETPILIKSVGGRVRPQSEPK